MSSASGEADRPSGQSELRLVALLLGAIEDSLSSLQRLLEQVHGEVDALLRDDSRSSSGGASSGGEGEALRREIDQLRYALISRPTIERAKGALMQRHRISETESFALLNKESQRQGKKLRDVAAEVTKALDPGVREPESCETGVDDARSGSAFHLPAEIPVPRLGSAPIPAEARSSG